MKPTDAADAIRGRVIHLARVTIETTAPLTIGTGAATDLDDSVCVTDANGLPAIPGSSIAGVLRSALAERDPHQDARCRVLFGYQDPRRPEQPTAATEQPAPENANPVGQASHVMVSWAQVHDANNRPVRFLGQRVEGDHVLSLLAIGVRRDHVRLNDRGVVDGRGKFDERLVPRGARFTFEISVLDRSRNDLDDLLARLGASTMRWGGRTRRGFGSFTVVRVDASTFDLSNSDDRKRYGRLPVGLHEPVPSGVLERVTVAATAPPGLVRIRLSLAPEDHWLFGGGEPVRPEHARQGSPIDMLPVSEPWIRWKKNQAKVVDAKDVLLVPASGVKGALRHRTAFHARRLEGHWALEAQPAALSDAKDPDAVRELFGEVIDHDEGTGHPGRVWLSDVQLAVSPADAAAPRDGRLDHVSLDRFTGGARAGLLFSEAPLLGGQVELVAEVDRRGLSANAGRALGCALRDLAEGRLALGAGSSRGHGYFRGEVHVDGDESNWLGWRHA